MRAPWIYGDQSMTGGGRSTGPVTSVRNTLDNLHAESGGPMGDQERVIGAPCQHCDSKKNIELAGNWDDS